MWCQIYIHNCGNPKRRRRQQQQQRAAAAVACMCPDTSPWPCRLWTAKQSDQFFMPGWAPAWTRAVPNHTHTHAPCLTRAVPSHTHMLPLSLLWRRVHGLAKSMVCGICYQLIRLLHDASWPLFTRLFSPRKRPWGAAAAIYTAAVVAVPGGGGGGGGRVMTANSESSPSTSSDQHHQHRR